MTVLLVSLSIVFVIGSVSGLYLARAERRAKRGASDKQLKLNYSEPDEPRRAVVR